MRNILTLIFILASLTINAQVVGKTTVLKVNGNPNLVVGLEDQTGYYESTLAQDTSSGLWYDWKAGRVPVWQETHTAANTSAVPFGAITGTNLEQQIQQVYAAIPLTNITSNVYYVSKSYGNNTTAEVGNPLRPWYDPWTADLVAGDSAIIKVIDGLWTVANTSSGISADWVATTASDSLLLGDKPYRVYDFEYNSGISMKGNENYYLFVCDTNQVIRILGNGIFKSQSNTRIAFIEGLSNFEMEFDTLIASTDSGWGLQFQINNTGQKVNIRGKYAYAFEERIFNIGSLPPFYTWKHRGVRRTSTAIAQSAIPTDINIRIEFLDLVNNDDAFRLNSWSVNTNILIKIGTIRSQNAKWNIFNFYRNCFINSSMSIRIENLYTINSTSANAGVINLGGDLNNSSIDIEIANGIVDGTCITTDWGAVGGSSTNSVDSLASNGVFNIRTGSLFRNKGGFYVPVVNILATDSVLVNLAANIYSDSSACVSVRMNGESAYFGGIHYLSLEGKYITAKGPAILLNGNNTEPTNIYFDNMYVENQTGNPAISATTTQEVNVGTLTDLGAKSIDPDITYISTKNYLTWKTNTFTATFSQSTFTTTPAKLPTNSPNLVVLKNGLEQTDTVNYTYVPSTGVITFIPALTGGEVMKIRWFD